MSPDAAPLRGAILVGGGSVRMGRPKALLEHDGRSFAERVHEALAPVVVDVVLAGKGETPESLAGLDRVPDDPVTRGPLAALVALARHDPAAAWLVCACDLPRITPEACAWLVAQRGEGRCVVMPTRRGGPPEPLLAIYEPGAAALLDELVGEGRRGPSALAGRTGVASPEIPGALEPAWRDVDTPDELSGL